jgi:hypothetical protein
MEKQHSRYQQKTMHLYSASMKNNETVLFGFFFDPKFFQKITAPYSLFLSR